MKKASKLQMADLIEIAAMRGVRAEPAEDADASGEQETGGAEKAPPGGSSGSGSKSPTAKTPEVPPKSTSPSSAGTEETPSKDKE